MGLVETSGGGCHVVIMTTLLKTFLVVALLGLAGCANSGVPQDGRYQTHGNASWDNWRG